MVVLFSLVDVTVNQISCVEVIKQVTRGDQKVLGLT